jgi:hypothetical protein
MDAMEQRPCSKCNKRKRRAPRQRYCKKCHNEYMRGWRPPYKNLTESGKIKNRARAYANVYEHRGKLKRRSRCEDCGRRRVLEKHHADYAQPLEVRWLCIPCHKLIP